MFDGPVALFARALERPDTAAVLTREPLLGTLIAMTLLSLFAILLLPRQFHVTVVENNSEAEIRRAAWLFPLYLVLINLFVVPIALAGLLTFPPGQFDSDMFVLALPLAAGYDLLTIAAFIGGLSAATAMVIVESVALAIMVSNDIVMPLVLQRRETLLTGSGNVGRMLLTVRRARDLRHPVLRLPLLPPGRRRAARLHRPPVLRRHRAARAGLLRRPDLAARHRARRLAGMTAGILVWAYTLLLPSFVGRRHRRAAASSAEGPCGHGDAAAAGAVRARPAAAGARRALEPGAQHPRLCRLLARRARRPDRAAAGRPVRAVRPGADRAELPALALVGHGRGADRHRRPLSRRGAHAHLVRQLCADRAASASTRRRGRLPAAALRRASAGLGDRRGLVAARAVAAAAQADGVDQGRAQAARRRQRGDPVQPRNPADRARPRAAGHRRVRQGPAPGLLEPAVRRDPRPAAGARPRRHRARRDPALQRRDTARSAPASSPMLVATARPLRHRQRAVPASASPTAAW